MKKYMEMLKNGYREDLRDCIRLAECGLCPPWRQSYCFGEIAAAQGTDAYPADGDALLAELRSLTDTVQQITDREESAAELAALGGELLFHCGCDGALVELAALPGGQFDGWVYLDGAENDAELIEAELKAWAAAHAATAAQARDVLAEMYRELEQTKRMAC